MGWDPVESNGTVTVNMEKLTGSREACKMAGQVGLRSLAPSMADIRAAMHARA